MTHNELSGIIIDTDLQIHRKLGPVHWDKEEHHAESQCSQRSDLTTET